MPLVQLFCSSSIRDRFAGDLSFVRKLAGDQLSVEEWPTDETHISVVMIPISAAIQLGEVEILIFAHEFADRVARRDTICSAIRRELEARWSTEVRVWLQLGSVGYGKKSQ